MKDHIIIEPFSHQPIEMVERKGIGHPDTVCDAIAEAISQALCRYYLREFGAILHHNVDKALLVGGQSAPAFGGGEIAEPMELIVAGRATQQAYGRHVPVDEIAIATAKGWLKEHFRFLDVERHVVIQPRIRPGSSDLVALFTRFGKGETPLANDTSFGAGYYPLSELERTAIAIEQLLNAPATRQRFPFVGEDTKVMGVQDGEQACFTIAIAMVSRFISSPEDYIAKVKAVRSFIIRELILALDEVDINTADDYAKGSFYLTVTGTSAEAGDDGQVGRGNRANGLITPYRPMSLEALAGKNPVSHVGKIYNLFAMDLARDIVEHQLAKAAEVFIVSQIGHPIDEPQVLHIRLKEALAGNAEVKAFAMDRLKQLPHFWRKVVSLKEQVLF